jgi:hypothetical protein
MKLVKIRQWLSYAAVVLSILGIITFSLFIFEEAFQTTMFGTWPAQDAKNWHLVLEGVDIMKSVNLGLKIVNYTVGWMQPLAFFSYRAYARSADYYVKALEAKVFAFAPETFDGRTVDIIFTPIKIERTSGGVKYINRKITVESQTYIPAKTIRVKGKCFLHGTHLIIKSFSVFPVK